MSLEVPSLFYCLSDGFISSLSAVVCPLGFGYVTGRFVQFKVTLDLHVMIIDYHNSIIYI